MHGEDRAGAVPDRLDELEAAVRGERVADRVGPRGHLVGRQRNAEVRLDLGVVTAVALGVDDLHAPIVEAADCGSRAARFGACRSVRAAHPEASPAPPPARPRSSGWSTGRWRPSRRRTATRSARSRSSSRTSRRPSSSPRTASSRTTGCTGCTRACPGPSTPPTGPRRPNRITLFRLPLEEDFPDADELEEEVRMTVLHELAHHLGIDDDRLDELGAG